MSAPSPQDFGNHKRLVTGYHVVAAMLIVLNLGFAGWTLVRGLSFANAVHFTTAIALLLVWFYARFFALAVQNRVIRLEERLRFQRLLPAELHPRIDDFTTGQMVALRFASDGEVAALAKRVLDENITDLTAIKKLVTSWRADECRA